MNTAERLAYMRAYQRDRYANNAEYRAAQIIRTNRIHFLNRLSRTLMNKINNTHPIRILKQFGRRIYKNVDFAFRIPERR
jgi:hypothetical protein